MAAYYILKPIECPGSHTDSSESRCLLEPATQKEAQASPYPIVKTISPDRFDKMELLGAGSNELLHSLVEAESNFVDVYPSHIIGSFSVPDKENQLKRLDTFAFFADERRLIFADSTGTAEEVLSAIASQGVLGSDTTAHCLYAFMKQLLVDEVAYMARMTDEMESLEEEMLERHGDVDTVTIMVYRRQSMRLSAYYEQLGTMATILADNENKLLTADEARSFSNIFSFADRLAQRAESLENYSLQLHELHQTRIDLAQNSIMQTLTVVTVIIAPLTLMTGWFGMNVELPGSDFPFMWMILLTAGVVVSALLILRFFKKKWL